MNRLLLILIIIALFFAAYFYLTKIHKGKGSRKEHTLRQELRRKLRQPPSIADETIKRYIIALEKRHPNRSQEWYLEKILYDLNRDRG